MPVTTHAVEQLMSLFAGASRAHGIQRWTNGEPTHITVGGPITPAEWEAHVAGEFGIGPVPIREDGTCIFGAIDIDVEVDHTALYQEVTERQIPLSVCRSKSGGAHLYCFLREPVKAALLIAALKKWAAALGYPKAEIFPKQSRLNGHCKGSWINAPYFAGEHTVRYAVGADGALTLEQFLASVTFWDCKDLGDITPTPDGKQARSPTEDVIPDGRRNQTLFELARSWRNIGVSVEEALARAKQQPFKPPLSTKEITATVRSAYSRKASPPFTQLGNAERLVARHGRDLRYCFEQKQFFVWDSSCWVEDTSGRVERFAKETVRELLAEAARIEDDGGRKQLIAHERASESAANIAAMIKLAQSEPGIPIGIADFDCDPLLLNVENGTIDLRTGAFREHRREDLISKASPATYDPQARCELWIQFLSDVTRSSRELMDFLQRAVGYSLTGLTIEHVLFMLYGIGANGKSTFLEVLRYALGDYAGTADFSTFTVSDRSAGPRNDIAKLRGDRFVTAIESEDGKRLAEALVKQVTGSDTLTARFLFREFFDFKPQFKLWFATNHKPKIRGTDEGIWRRIRLIPFTVQIPPSKRDRNLAEKLKKESNGILNWALAGLREYQRLGLGEPASVNEATQQYRAEQDVLGHFIADCCVLAPAASVHAKPLYAAFRKWAEESGERSPSDQVLKERFEEHGFKWSRKGGTGTKWFGIGLLAEMKEEL